MLTNQKKGLKRNTIDKYYTNDSVVDLCINKIKECLVIDPSEHLIIEPSAGNGSFIKGIRTLSNHCLFYDLEPENPDIIKQDYLEYNIVDKYDNIHVIGNPPFGRQSSLAIKFIKKSCEFCNSISFILPLSFKKESLKRHFPLQFHLIYEYDLPKDAFLVNNAPYDVPCVFQIWEKKSHKRIVIEKLKPNHYTFVKKIDNPDISFRRVGVNAGMINVSYQDKSEQSHYFIKFSNSFSEKMLEELKTIQYPGRDHTVGPKSISKQEVIKQFNPLLD
jgi:predicted RNA methylase